MDCPSCSHLMSCFSCPAPDVYTYRCVRCGTVKTGEVVHVPQLVERCLAFTAERVMNREFWERWREHVIAEAVHTEEERQHP